jgi:hypothetical protein
MAILPSSNKKQPLLVHSVAPNVNFAQQQVQHLAAPIQQQQTVEPILIKHIDWSHNKIDPAVKTRSTSVSHEDKIDALLDSIRTDLAKLRQLHRAIMEATHFDIVYEKNNANKEQEYSALLKRVNELSREQPSQELLNELKIIEDELELDCANIDTLFPQMIYKATYMENLMAIRVELIGYEELKAEALAALNGIRSARAELATTTRLEQEHNDYTPISAVVHTISVYNEMQQYKANILALQVKDQVRANKTRKSVMAGMAVTLLILIGTLVTLNYYNITWREIRNFPILGIPMGIVVWSFIGSFAAMLSQFYQKPVQEFGNTIKWVIIRPVLGVVMGAAVYLALYSLVLSTSNTNSLLPLLVAFFVGYSDTFTFDILNTIQRTITGMFNANQMDNTQPVYVLPHAPQHVPVAQEEPVVKKAPKPTAQPLPDKLPLRPDNLPTTNPNAGEDE